MQWRQKDGEDNSKARAACVGEGLPPIPPKLVERIKKGDLVKICKLISEFWMVNKGKEDVPAQRVAWSKGSKHSQNIHMWL